MGCNEDRENGSGGQGRGRGDSKPVISVLKKWRDVGGDIRQ